jgi:hypothetical protein
VTRRRETERELRVENRRLKAALGAIHDRLHADDVDGAHEQCECALEGKAVTQPNLSVENTAKSMDFATRFNALADSARVRACCVLLLPSKTIPGATSLQICGEVNACKVVEQALRGSSSVYMGDHAQREQEVV